MNCTFLSEFPSLYALSRFLLFLTFILRRSNIQLTDNNKKFLKFELLGASEYFADAKIRSWKVLGLRFQNNFLLSWESTYFMPKIFSAPPCTNSTLEERTSSLASFSSYNLCGGCTSSTWQSVLARYFRVEMSVAFITSPTVSY